jgi:hypothetical protein
MKDKGEKVGEVVTLLKKLISVGIPSTDSGYKQTKALMDAWILGEYDMEEKIEFMRYGRVGHLSMFVKEGKSPVFVLKATDELKEQEQDALV